MSTIRHLINFMNSFSKSFLMKFDFYINSFDTAISYQSKIGLNRTELSSLTELDQKLVQSYLSLAESSNTTAMGALRLLISNFYSDAYSLIRILYEIACLMHYGNSTRENKIELYEVFYNSKLPEYEHQKKEWRLIKKSQSLFEKEKPGLIDVRKKLNSFGSHISRKKVVLGNMTALEESSTSTLFTDNSSNRYYLAGLEFTHSMYVLILEEYAKHLQIYNGSTSNDIVEIRNLSSNFLKKIRPRLVNMVKNIGYLE
ncbi:MAG: hypothetical protein P9L89_06890 [Candidatus Celaenobacter polaris]|nr:hypothetical protein [Candidatus Celaenobacter polaris]